jgi:hypothetical protein
MDLLVVPGEKKTKKKAKKTKGIILPSFQGV